MGVSFFQNDVVAEVGFLFMDHHAFAQENWRSTALGKNYLIRLGENFLHHALVHSSGVHVFKYPLGMLELNRDEYQSIFEQTETLNPPMDFDLPEINEINIRLFKKECTGELLDFDWRRHRAVNNFYYGPKDGWIITLVFMENHVMGVGIESNLIVW